MKLKNLITAFLSVTASGLMFHSLSANTILFDNGAADLTNPNETYNADYGTMIGNVFTASVGGSANFVNFAGLYWNSNTAPTTDSFTLSLYSVSGGTPTSLIGTSTLSGVSRSVIGTTLNEVNYLFQHLTVYQFGGSLDNPFTLTAGQSYYLGFTDYDSPSQGFDLAYSTGSATTLYQGMTGGNGNTASIGRQWAGNPLSFSVSTAAVPEPSTYALFGLGALALVMAYRLKREYVIVFAMFALLTSFAGSAKADLIKFDDLSDGGYGTAISDGYGALNWNNFFVLTPSINFNFSGYKNGIVSGNNVAYNGGGLDASISSSTPFTLNSGYFTSAWQNGLNITIQGYVGATPTSSVSFIVDTAAPVFETINLQNITSATFTSGISQFALDNLSVNAVPEPSTYALFGLGALVLVMAERRKRAA